MVNPPERYVVEGAIYERVLRAELEALRLRKELIETRMVAAVACGLSLGMSVCALFWAVWGGE
jgi:hypothetical protein